LPAYHDLVVTTDGFTVQPIEFLGGNIGSLAVHGTVNDLAMLRRVVDALAIAARDCSLAVIAGDTRGANLRFDDSSHSRARNKHIPSLWTRGLLAARGDVLKCACTLGLAVIQLERTESIAANRRALIRAFCFRSL
jgi:hypothetical protein